MVRPRRDVVAPFLPGSCEMLRRRLVQEVTGRSRRQHAAGLLFTVDSSLVTALDGWVGECRAFTCQGMDYAGIR